MAHPGSSWITVWKALDHLGVEEIVQQRHGAIELGLDRAARDRETNGAEMVAVGLPGRRGVERGSRGGPNRRNSYLHGFLPPVRRSGIGGALSGLCKVYPACPPKLLWYNDILCSPRAHRISTPARFIATRALASARARRIKCQNGARRGSRALFDLGRCRRFGDAHQKAHL